MACITPAWSSHELSLKEFEVKKQAVLDDILENVEERFGYLEKDPVLKAAAVLDPDVWSKCRTKYA